MIVNFTQMSAFIGNDVLGGDLINYITCSVIRTDLIRSLQHMNVVVVLGNYFSVYFKRYKNINKKFVT